MHTKYFFSKKLYLLLIYFPNSTNLLNFYKFSSSNLGLFADVHLGWCVDSLGNQVGRESNMNGVWPPSECYEKCEADTALLKGCAYNAKLRVCVTYSGNVIQGSGDMDYRCYIPGLDISQHN